MLNKNEVILYLVIDEILRGSVGHSKHYTNNQTWVNQLYDELGEGLPNTSVKVFNEAKQDYKLYKADLTLALEIYSK